MHTYVLEREQLILRPRSEVFAFFGDAFNLERITPPFLKFRILTPAPITMRAGTVIEYKLSLYGLAFKWRTLIEAWTPEESFIDRQTNGPYALWHHTHTFAEAGPQRTLMRDHVRYQLPFGIFGRLAHWLFVRRALEQIFNYRFARTAQLLGSEAQSMATATRSAAIFIAGD